MITLLWMVSLGYLVTMTILSVCDEVDCGKDSHKHPLVGMFFGAVMYWTASILFGGG